MILKSFYPDNPVNPDPPQSPGSGRVTVIGRQGLPARDLRNGGRMSLVSRSYLQKLCFIHFVHGLRYEFLCFFVTTDSHGDTARIIRAER